jgi:enterochelin esterase-like enzyme
MRLMTALLLTVALAGTTNAQGPRGGAARGGAVRAGTVEHVTERDDRKLTVYLPPDYAADAARRFPVIYFLRGDAGPTDALIEAIKGPADRLAALQGFSEPIVVAPESLPKDDGERFIAEDLVAYIDMHYRTLAARISRGLAGDSMGGYAALQVGTKRPDVFSSLYLMSACCLDGTDSTLEQNASNLQKYYAVAIEIGTKDPSLAANRKLHDALVRLRIPHNYQEYDGDHAAKAAERFERNLLPFFSKNLAAPANPTSPAVR